MWTLQRLDPDRIDWSDLDRFEDRMFSQRREWLDFITAFVNGEIVVAAVERSGERVGYFTGVLFRRLGVPILGSPFRGWTTPYMGSISIRVYRARGPSARWSASPFKTSAVSISR